MKIISTPELLEIDGENCMIITRNTFGLHLDNRSDEGRRGIAKNMHIYRVGDTSEKGKIAATKAILEFIWGV